MALSATYTAEILMKVSPLIQRKRCGRWRISARRFGSVETETLNRRRNRHYFAFAVLQGNFFHKLPSMRVYECIG